ncbi:DUF2273 domain-containing protein [Streptococcus pluranimalium]|uniref:Membrane protein n=1 Tax=Streptococcus acidominimus TaxID=1326 RepID=A0A239X0R8_STRAI|nr:MULTISPECIES: DUF2273 domain-containing protein [Streptococcus]MDY3025117.1 DUF2273 domain-containing protein [Streptococcus hyovaginalis]SNV40345.1 membrane protein [Streptococcus acidominimus]
MELFEKYKYPIIGGGLAFFLALLLVTFGFFKTLLVLILVVAGTFAGYYLQETGLIDRFFENFK